MIEFSTEYKNLYSSFNTTKQVRQDWSTYEQDSILFSPDCNASPLKNGMVRLSLSPNGSHSSTKVATRAPMTIGYSRKCTSLKATTPTSVHVMNIATLPSIDFLPSLPIFKLHTSPPKLTPNNAAAISPTTRKIIATIATDVGKNVMVSEHPRLKYDVPLRFLRSCSRMMLFSSDKGK